MVDTTTPTTIAFLFGGLYEKAVNGDVEKARWSFDKAYWMQWQRYRALRDSGLVAYANEAAENLRDIQERCWELTQEELGLPQS